MVQHREACVKRENKEEKIIGEKEKKNDMASFI